MYRQYLDRGMCIIPLKDGRPLAEWSRWFFKLPTEKDISSWQSDEFALLCGKVSGVIALDIDTDDAARIYALAGATNIRKRGSKGFTAFYRYNGEASQNWKDASGNVICEILSDKRLTTIPPSKHRKTGKPYVWMDGVGLLDVSELPALADDFVLFMDAKFPKHKPFAITPPRAVADYDDIGLADAQRMLGYISADCPRDEWVQVGMALRDEYGDAACHIWHEWSATSPKYNHNAAQACWRSFSNDGVTIATLVYFAKRGGWAPEPAVTSPAPATPKKPQIPIYAGKPRKPTQEVSVGGLVGEIANWITSTAIRPQPKLSLAAALSFVGAMKGHRVQSSIREARTNLLILSLAPTGGGKDHPQYATQKLMRACGLERMVMGRPTSGTAMLTGLNKAAGVGWLKVDEFGRYLSNATNRSAQSHQREIVDYMIELYSCANRTFYGRQYANDKENPQIVIEQPHFCCIGSTVEEKLKEACKSSEVIDGFLNRWLVFNSSDRPHKNLTVTDLNPPEALVARITQWLNDFPLKHDSYGVVTPQEISFTPEAWDGFLAFEAKVERLIAKTPYPLNELYARAGEHVVKLATTLADDLWVGVPELRVAVMIAEESIASIMDFASGISDNQHQENVNYLLDIIGRAGSGGIGRNELTQRTRRLTNRERVDILNQLAESEEIRVDKSGSKIIFYAN